MDHGTDGRNFRVAESFRFEYVHRYNIEMRSELRGRQTDHFLLFQSRYLFGDSNETEQIPGNVPHPRRNVQILTVQRSKMLEHQSGC